MTKLIIIAENLLELIVEIYIGDPHDWVSKMIVALSATLASVAGFYFGAPFFDPCTWQAAVMGAGLWLLFRFGTFDTSYATGRGYEETYGDNFTDKIMKRFIERHKYNQGVLVVIKDFALITFLAL